MKTTSAILKRIALGALLIAAAVLTSSCRGLSLSASSPWGDVGSVDGQTVVTLRPIIIHEK